MNIEEFKEYCLSLKGVHEKMPFSNIPDKYSRDVLCFYVADKNSYGSLMTLLSKD